MVIFRLWSLNVLQMCFLMFSISLGVLLNAARPSSLYRPISLPYSVGHKFLKAIDECFPQTSHPLHKILNKNTIKLSYSCMPNMHNVISAHNKAVLSKQSQLNDTNNSKSKECNCRQKDSCPLSGKCLTDSVVYQATQ